MILAIDHAAGEGLLNQVAERLRRPLRVWKGVLILGGLDLVAFNTFVSRDVTSAHEVFAFSHPIRTSALNLLSKFLDGTMHKKKTWCGFVANTKRKRLTFPPGKYLSAKSSVIRCSVSRFWPLIGTLTKHSSSDQ